MKCPNCSAPLMIEDAFCRYCGKENPYFVQHREDLKDFTEEFEETHQEVLQKVHRTSRISVNIVVICTLVMLNVITFWAISNVWEFEYYYEDWQTNKYEATHRTALEAYSDAGDILGMHQYMRRQVDIYGTNLEDYYAIQWAAQQYNNIYSDIMYLTVLQGESYETQEELCESISTSMVYFYDAITQDSYDDEAYFSEEHKATLAMIQTQLEALFAHYLNIPAEDIPALLELSDARRAIAIEEGVLGYED